MKVIHSRVEGNVSYDSLLFIPSKPPMNYYSNEYEKGYNYIHVVSSSWIKLVN